MNDAYIGIRQHEQRTHHITCTCHMLLTCRYMTANMSLCSTDTRRHISFGRPGTGYMSCHASMRVGVGDDVSCRVGVSRAMGDAAASDDAVSSTDVRDDAMMG